jgi:protein PhnA
MSKTYGDDIDWENWEYDPNDDWTWTSANDDEEVIVVKDANWNILQAWDTVMAIKDLPVKGGQDIKRWDKFPKIRLTDDEWLIESWKMVLKTEFFKKV